jgi:hypothetical protein
MNLLTQLLALFRAEARGTLSSVLRRLRRRGWASVITALIWLLRGRRGGRGVLATLPRAGWRRLSHSQASQAAGGKQVEREEPFFH